MNKKKLNTILIGGKTMRDDIKGLMRRLGCIDCKWYKVEFYATNRGNIYIDSLMVKGYNNDK